MSQPVLKKTAPLFFFCFVCLSVFATSNSLPTDSLERVISVSSEDAEKVNALNELSWMLASKDPKKSVALADKAIELARNLRDSTLLADGYNRKALGYDYLAQYDSALYYYKTSFRLRKKMKDRGGAANVLNNIGACFYYRSRYDSALTYYLDAIKIRETLGDSSGLAQSYNNVGLIMKAQKEVEKAKRYFQKALAIKRRLKDIKGMMNVYTNLSGILIFQDDYKEASEMIKKGIELALQEGDSSYLATQYANLGVLHKRQEKYRSAISSLKKALKIYGKVGFEGYGKAQALNNLGEPYLAMEEWANAEKVFKQSLLIARKLDRKELMASNLQYLSSIHERRGNRDLALQYLKKYMDVREQYMDEKKTESINELHEKYEAEKRERIIAEEKARNRSQTLALERSRSRQHIFIAIIVFSVLIIGIITYLFNQRNQLNRKLAVNNNMLEKALEDKEVLLREIHHRVKNNLQVISSLLNLQARSIEDEKAHRAINESKNRVNSMALIHQKLYQREELTGVDTEEYINELTQTLLQTYALDQEQVRIKQEVQPLLLDVDTIIPLGLIINELLSNAMKYGVDSEKESWIELELKEVTAGLLFKLKDEGPGIPDGFDFEQAKSYGYKLIRSLLKKLQGSLELQNQNGLLVSLTIRNYKKLSPTIQNPDR